MRLLGILVLLLISRLSRPVEVPPSQVSPQMLRIVMNQAMKNFAIHESSVLVMVDSFCVEGIYTANLLSSSLLTYSRPDFSWKHDTAVVVSSTEYRIRFVCLGSRLYNELDQPLHQPCRQLFTFCLFLTRKCGSTTFVAVTPTQEIKTEEYLESNELTTKSLELRVPALSGVRLIPPECRCMNFANVSPLGRTVFCQMPTRAPLTESSSQSSESTQTRTKSGATETKPTTRMSKTSEALKKMSKEDFTLSTWVTYELKSRQRNCWRFRNSTRKIHVIIKLVGWVNESQVTVDNAVLTCFIPVRHRVPSCLAFFRAFTISTWVSLVLVLISLISAVIGSEKYGEQVAKYDFSKPKTLISRHRLRLGSYVEPNRAYACFRHMVLCVTLFALGIIVFNLNRSRMIADFMQTFDDVETREIAERHQKMAEHIEHLTLHPFWLQTREHLRQDTFGALSYNTTFCTTENQLFLHAFQFPTAVYSRSNVFRDAIVNGEKVAALFKADTAVRMIQKFALLPTGVNRAFPMKFQKIYFLNSIEKGAALIGRIAPHFSYRAHAKALAENFGAATEYKLETPIGLPARKSLLAIVAVVIITAFCMGMTELWRKKMLKLRLSRLKFHYNV